VVARALVLALLGAAVAAAGCSGGKGVASATMPALLDKPSFAAVVGAAIERDSQNQADPEGRSALLVTHDLDRVILPLDSGFARYRAHPSERDEIVAGLVDEAQKRVQDGIPRASLDTVRAYVMPLLKPAFDLRRLSTDPPRRPFGKGLSVVYGIDKGGEFTLIQMKDLLRWHLTLAELDRLAQKNLVHHTEPLLCEEQLCGWAGGDGYDATRMTSATLRAEIEKKIGRAAYAVPLEDVFVAVPIAYAARIKAKVLQEFTTGEKPVSPDVFVEREGRLVPLDS
jgi:Protein of unknown function (DUF1444)